MKKRILPVLLLTLLIGVMLCRSTPERRIENFIARHGDTLAAAVETDGGIPADIGIRLWNPWAGAHEMTEFILWTRGNTYYGCYYSPDDVPLAFQNMEIPLEPQSDGSWIWRGAGDNRGCTWRGRENWYGFSASF